MSQVERQELEQFRGFYRRYYEDDIAELAQRYPNERRSLYVSYDDLYRFDADLAERYLNKPEDLREIAEEALRTYDLPADVSLGQAHVRLQGLPAGNTIDIRNIRVVDDHVGSLVAVQGIVRKATDVRPKIVEAAFECQRCGTMTYIPQSDAGFQEPHECQGCERQGPFRINHDQSEFVDAQTIRVQESPEGLRGGETPQAIDVYLEDDVCGQVTPGDHVSVAGVLHIEQQTSGNEKTALFDLYMDGVTVTIEDEEFEDMDISDADVTEILELADSPDIYEKMVDSVAPSIYGYDQEKLAIVLQLFGGVTKHLPDESRIRGDLHMLLIGDPGTGKSQLLSYTQNIAPRSVYTSGKGSSAAGLTAAAVRDDFGDGQQWTLEAGALVLADKGVAAIDELDKMAEDDRSAMHEALEQQSYHPNEEILLADGRRVRIGDFVDDAMQRRPDDVTEGVDCEILSLDDTQIHSVDLDAGDVEKLPVDRVSRHEAPDEFVRVEFSNGRSVTVTPDHPMFVDTGGVETVQANELEGGEFVPAPRALPNAAEPVALDDTEQVGKEKDVRLPEEMSPELAEILGFLIAEGHSYAGSAHEIGFSNQDERLLERMDRLFADVFGMESTDTTNEAGTVTKRWVSTKLYRWFESNFPELMHTARDKRMPAAVLGASTEEIRRFLVGAFAGDGSVESEAMALCTASTGLARDYADALSKLGVASRLHHDPAQDSWKTYVMGDSTAEFVEQVVEPADERYDDAVAFAERSESAPRHHDVLPASAAAEIRSLRQLVGLGLTGRFRPNVDEQFGVQIETVHEQIETVREHVTSVRDRLDTVTSLSELRELVGWSGRQLAERLDGETTSAVHYAEDGGYNEERRERMLLTAREAVRETVDEATDRLGELEERCRLRYYKVTDVETIPNEGEDATDWVYDVTVEPTNTFVSSGVVLHNSISISKAGINATLKSRCSLLGAANPKYGRFDQYEPIGEQIDLEPALISRFDLIFTVTDQPDPDHDAKLADHILTTNYAGELNTQQTEMTNSEVTRQQVENVQEEVAPVVDAELLRKYVAYSKRTCYPRLTDAARDAIQEFYVDLRSKGADEDAPVPVTARKLEATVRLAEASARVRLADEVSADDAERVIDIVRSCLQDIGVDPETGEFDADVVETGTSKSQRDRIKGIKDLLREVDEEYEDEPGAPRERVMERADEVGMEASKVEAELEKLKTRGDVYLPDGDHIKLV